MPPALHPRSVFTTSLFTTTLALSFVVVGLPHLIPCPVDSSHYADGQLNGLNRDPSLRRRRKRTTPIDDDLGTQDTDNNSSNTSPKQFTIPHIQRQHSKLLTSTPSSSAASTSAIEEQEQDSKWAPTRRTRECPVPKPGGLIGQVLGFNSQQASNSTVGKPNVKIKSAQESPRDSPPDR